MRRYEAKSLLHHFICFIVDREFHDTDVNDEMAELMRQIPERRTIDEAFVPTLWIEDALKCFGFEHDPFASWVQIQGYNYDDINIDTISEYNLELRLCGPLEDLLDRIAEEVFFVLFPNRNLLFQFNSVVAMHVERLDVDKLEEENRILFERDGMLKRVPVPSWCRRAVFFRERGRCAACQADLSHIISLQAEPELDHIVPLHEGGINDVSNLQLLCQKCNRMKGPRAFTSIVYERWY